MASTDGRRRARVRAARPANAAHGAAPERTPTTPRGANALADTTPRGWDVTVARAALAAVVFFAAVAVDPAALASFDAPKRLATQLGSVLAAAALLIGARRMPSLAAWRSLAAAQRVIAALLGVAVVAAMLAAVLSPRVAIALPALRALLVTALLIPLGASRALDGAGAKLLLGAFFAGAAVNAAVSLVERASGASLVGVAQGAGRVATVALVGNEGSLALLLALAAVAALALALQAGETATRVCSGALAALLLAGVVANASLTALLAFAAGAIAVVLLALPRRAVLLAAAAGAVLALAALLHEPLRARVADALDAARAGDLDVLVTHRTGPWAAAVEMVRARPLAGFGPGTFAAEFVPHRLAAELRHGRRFLVPRETSTYGEAHCDYLQAFAEGGVVAGAAVIAALALLLVILARRARAASGAGRRARVLLLGLLVAGAVAALTWFPLQQPSLAPVLLLALGRAWRALAPEPSADATSETAAASATGVAAAHEKTHEHGGQRGRDAIAWVVLRWTAAVLLLASTLPPELRRLAVEHELQHATAEVRAALASGTQPSPAFADRVAARVAPLAEVLRGDSRALLVAGGAQLAARRPERALEHYREAFARGERAEIDLNAGRAFAILDRRQDAFAAFVRTAWLSPALVPALPAAAQPLVDAEVARLEAELRAGRLAAPPPLPEALRADAAP